MKQIKIDFSAVIDIDVDDTVTEEEIMDDFESWWGMKCRTEDFLIYSKEEEDLMPGLVRLTSVEIK